MSQKRQFAINAIGGWGEQASAMIVGFVSMPYLIHKLGDTSYGMYQLSSSMLVFFSFLSLGVGPSLARMCSQAIAQKDEKLMRQLSSAAHLCLGLFGLVAMAGGVAIVPVFQRVYDVPRDLLGDARFLMLTLSLSVFLQFHSMVWEGVLRSANRYDIVSLTNATVHFLRLALILLLFGCFGGSLRLLGIAILSSQVLRWSMLSVFSFRRFGHHAIFSRLCLDLDTVKSLLSFGSMTVLGTIGNVLIMQGPVLVVGRTLGAEAVTALAPAILIANSMQSVLGQLVSPLVPVAGRNRVEGNGNQLGKWALLIGQFIGYVGCGIVLPLCVYGPELMGFWLGTERAWVWSLVAISSTAMVGSTIQAATYYLALGAGSIRPVVFSAVALAIVSILGTWLGTTYWGWSLLCVLIFLACGRGVRNVLYIPAAYAHSFAYCLGPYFLEVYGKTGLIFILFLGLGYFVRQVFPPINIFWVFGEISVLAFVYLLVVWRGFLATETRGVLLGLVPRFNSIT